MSTSKNSKHLNCPLVADWSLHHKLRHVSSEAFFPNSFQNSTKNIEFVKNSPSDPESQHVTTLINVAQVSKFNEILKKEMFTRDVALTNTLRSEHTQTLETRCLESSDIYVCCCFQLSLISCCWHVSGVKRKSEGRIKCVKQKAGGGGGAWANKTRWCDVPHFALSL